MVRIDEVNVKIRISNKTFFGNIGNGSEDIYTNEKMTEYSEFCDHREYAEEGEQGEVFWATNIYNLITQEEPVSISKYTPARKSEVA